MKPHSRLRSSCHCKLAMPPAIRYPRLVRQLAMGDKVTSVAASDAAENANTPFQHDVFISYSHKDGSWVQDEFVPQLRGAGLDVLIDSDFAIGKPSVQNMTSAVRDSRYIVAILTQNW